MKLHLNKTCVLHPDASLEDKLPWIITNDKIVLDSKYTIWDEYQMVKTIQWLDDNTSFDKYELLLFLEDCVSLVYG